MNFRPTKGYIVRPYLNKQTNTQWKQTHEQQKQNKKSSCEPPDANFNSVPLEKSIIFLIIELSLQGLQCLWPPNPPASASLCWGQACVIKPSWPTIQVCMRICHAGNWARYSGTPLRWAMPRPFQSHQVSSDEYYGTNHWILRRLLSVVLWETMQSVLRNGSFSQAWWYKVVIPAASEAQWEGWEMQVSLGSRLSPKTKETQL